MESLGFVETLLRLLAVVAMVLCNGFFVALPVTLRVISAHSVAVAIAFVAITSLHIVLGEQVPKIMTLQYAEPVALYTTKLTELFMKVCRPLITSLNWITNTMLSGPPRRVLCAVAGIRAPRPGLYAAFH
jgi:CBS domain containing-hemolysin-like protein